jgi:ATP synthase protein I
MVPALLRGFSLKGGTFQGLLPVPEQEFPPSRDSRPLDDIERRLSEARAREDATPLRRPMDKGVSGLGLGMRLAVDLAAGTAIGVGIGWGLDRWLGTKPWMVIVFSVLGWVAGVMNVYRTVRGMDETVGFAAAARRQDKTDRDK